jgi:hypothetical protein
MNDLIGDMVFVFFWLLAIIVVIGVTVVAVRSIRHGENPWKVFKKWFVAVIDAWFGTG